MNATADETKDDCARRLDAAKQLIQEHLVLAQETLAARGVAAPGLQMALPRAQPVYRVFRHDGLGLHFVVRDTDEMRGHTCVFGPVDAQGRVVTFANAVAFANRAFAAWAQSYLTTVPPEKFLEMSAAEMAREAERLAEWCGTPPAQGVT